MIQQGCRTAGPHQLDVVVDQIDDVVFRRELPQRHPGATSRQLNAHFVRGSVCVEA